MRILHISYDLRKVRNYEGLIRQLRAWNCISPLKSQWFGHFNGTASAVRDALRQHMDNDDGLLIVEVKPDSDWATFRVNENAATWLQTNVAA